METLFCWHCGERPASPGAEGRVKLTSGRRFTFFIIGYSQHWTESTVYIPRCRVCRRESRIREAKTGLGCFSILLAISLLILVGINTPPPRNVAVLASLLVIIVVGHTIYRKRRSHVISDTITGKRPHRTELGLQRSSLEHPSVLQLREQGWRPVQWSDTGPSTLRLKNTYMLSTTLAAAQTEQQLRARKAREALHASQHEQAQVQRQLQVEHEAAVALWNKALSIPAWPARDPEQLAQAWASAVAWETLDRRAADTAARLDERLRATGANPQSIRAARKTAEDYAALARLLAFDADQAPPTTGALGAGFSDGAPSPPASAGGDPAAEET